MIEIEVSYEGDLRTRCIHRDNGAEIVTDAPKDNQGLGELFSPTDLMAASLGSCTLTLMGITARTLKIDIKNTQAIVTKKMQTAPIRRIAQLTVDIRCPHQFSEEITQKLIRAAENCPVRYSLHPEIELKFTYVWG